MTAVDWSLIEDPEVYTACQDAASYVARKYHGVIEYDDLLQEAYVYVATHPEQIREWQRNETMRFVWGRLMNLADSYYRKRRKDVSLEELSDRWNHA